MNTPRETEVSAPSLEALSGQVRRDLDCIRYPRREWMPVTRHDGEAVLDVAIIGAGQGGLATAFALKRLNVDNVTIFDRAPRGGEGPWVTFARMITLRTPKYVTGPDLGVPSLTPRSWFSARYGADAWDALEKISRQDWQAYLDWFRQTLELPVENDRNFEGVTWENGLLRLTFRSADGGVSTQLARKLVLATGIDGGGCWNTPAFIREALPKSRYAHTSEAIDFAALRGKRVGVLGAGASAFDNAATALEAGVKSVELCLRRKAIPSVNPYRWMENTGFLAHFPSLPDLQRWRFMAHIYDLNQPPPQDTFWRCRRHEGFSFHTGCPWTGARMEGEEIVVDTPLGEKRFDFVIIGAGFTVDLKLRPETASFADAVALWRDRFTPPDGDEHTLIGAHPYLGDAYQFLPKDAADPRAPLLAAIHNFTFSATPSMGLSGASISGMRFGVDRLARGLTRDLFVTDGQWHLDSLLNYDTPELISTEPPPR
ncbi:oxidoreductase [Acetobacter nitrogenifigens DSM 23921 = NBRC 105050]|uniref:FAD-dependent urate hydroxylase n=1 Tax=Acetobacter nitrogenifigens DSM 23921 = NBRC 105050 TaxID=1120919 RepID=A0A511X5I0_9PROT|nr:NAD(P)/FAD-dependent oxidoreductase [Acetobacter nitrogenifigens]GBQ98206.1 oxidoreductase [Acetobacter nitrogenifigens DSM 23921 = NBRC 105050]GEN58193.1 FAD-dependent urate hydroxylase [Acetobacter nitrogenifigens DSM 23921 = NBRC 105050]